MPAYPTETLPYVVVATDTSLRQWAYGPFRTGPAAERFARTRNAAGDRRSYVALPLRHRDAHADAELDLALEEAREEARA